MLEAPEIFVIRIAFADCASQWLRELPSLNRQGIKPLRGRAWNASTIVCTENLNTGVVVVKSAQDYA